MSVVQHIHSFFKRHGSPVAPYAGAFVRFANKYGIDPYLLAAIAMKETEGGLTGTGRAGQYNLTGLGGVGSFRSYPGYKASIKDSARTLAGPKYRGKNLAQQTAMWVAGTRPSATTAPYTQDIRADLKMLGVTGLNTRGSAPRKPGTPSTPGQPAVPGMKGIELSDPSMVYKSLAEITGVPWLIPSVPRSTPDIPGLPAIPGRKGTKGSFSGNYPLGKRGKIIGTPGVGTHNGAPPYDNWQSSNAIDIGVPIGTPVVAIRDGKIGRVRVKALDGSRTSGSSVYLDFGGNEAWYMHLKSVAVKPGQRVKAGQVIGYSGEGAGTPHLHFALLHGNPYSMYGSGGGSASAPSGGKGAAGFKAMENVISGAKSMGLRPQENFLLGGVDPSVHVSGSYHNRRFPGNKNVGEAVDVYGTPKQMAAFWRWVKKTYPGVTELFYSPMGFIKNGKPTTLPANLVRSHYSHVHVAFGPGHYR